MPSSASTSRTTDIPSMRQSASALPPSNCPNPACKQAVPDLYSHLTAPNTPCATWALGVVRIIHGDVQEDDEVDEPPLIPAAQGSEFELLDTQTHIQATTCNTPPQLCSQLSRVVHPNTSMVVPGLKGYNTLQYIQQRDHLAQRRRQQKNVFLPFSSRSDWQIGKWLSDASLSLAQVNSFLKLEQDAHISLAQTKEHPPSFKSARELRQLIGDLPDVPVWNVFEMEVPGYSTKEPIVLYYRDGLSVVERLFGNPVFAGCMDLTPYKLYDNTNKRVFAEFMSGQFAYEQMSQTHVGRGETLVGVILASDKTPLTIGTGGKEMWPVLISIANIHAGVRMKATSHSFALVGYLPIPKFLNVSPTVQATLAARVYHDSMSKIVASLVNACRHGHQMPDPNGEIRWCRTVLASHIADLPEQRLIAGVLSNVSPTSLAGYDAFGDVQRHPDRTQAHQAQLIYKAAAETDPALVPLFVQTAAKHGLLGVHQPYWLHWGSADPSRFLTPDALHAWHKFYYDHIIKWVINIITGEELDRRLAALPRSVGVRHWSKGVSKLKQVTGREHRDLEKIIVPVIAGAVSADVLAAIRAITEFIFHAQGLLLYEDHLHAMNEALREFHIMKAAILRDGGRKGKNGPIPHFKIPKLEGMLRVSDNARQMGAPYQYTSDTTERCHITHVKEPYRHTNGRDFHAQCIHWMDRKEKVINFETYTALEYAGVDLMNIMVNEATDVANHYPEAAWLSHVLPPDQYSVTGAASRPSLFNKRGCIKVSDDLSTALLVNRTPHHRRLTILISMARLVISSSSRELKTKDVPGARVPTLARFLLSTSRCGRTFAFNSAQRRINLSYFPSRLYKRLHPRLQCPSGGAILFWSATRGTAYQQPILATQVRSLYLNYILDANLSKAFKVVQIRTVFSPIINNKVSPEVFCYAEDFLFAPEYTKDGVYHPVPNIDMFLLERHYRTTRSRDGKKNRVGDIIRLSSVREVVELVPVFGARISDHDKDDCEINCDNSLEKIDRFYLNNFASKETFHAILSYQ
ncbi:hypothetical protein HWV62_20051 [Athelia sp. TMB]|nr:hypothetical protein HWV62_20051 [Athelia sp. TMB]